MRQDARAESLIRRLGAVERRLLAITGRGKARGLTAPDPQTGEQWEAGQVWAHVAEFVPYWTRELRRVVAEYSTQPVPFGRVKSAPARLAAIEADRGRPPEEQAARITAALAELKALLRSLPSAAWSAQGRHQTLGIIDVERIVEEFLAGHLEEHAAQLESLSGEAGTA